MNPNKVSGRAEDFARSVMGIVEVLDPYILSSPRTASVSLVTLSLSSTFSKQLR